MTEGQTVAQAAQNASLPALIEASTAQFEKVLPSHLGAERYARWGLSVVRKALMGGTEQAERTRQAWIKVMGSEAGRLSVIAALMDCASLGLEPGREYHLVPFGETVTGITDYKGEIRLISNANPGWPVVAMLVRAKDSLHMVGANIPPVHNADWFGQRGQVVGGYAYQQQGNGLCSAVVRMAEHPDPDDPTVDSFAHHKAKARSQAVWDEWPEAMRLKTLVHQLRKWVAWSPEIRPQS